MILFYIVVLLLAFYLLNLFSEFYFIPSLDRIGEKLRMSSDISGATLMAIGSSAPELAVMIISVFKQGNHQDIGIGTIVGSALFNLFIITGVVMMIKSNFKLTWQPLVRDLLFYAVSVFILIFAFSDGHISLFEALGFLGFYAFYIFALYFWRKIFPYKDRELLDEEEDILKGFHEKLSDKLLDFNIYFVFLTSIAIIGGLSWLLVDSAIHIAEFLNIPEFIIALTVLAVGTSIPDLVSSAIVAKQGRAGMAIVNGIGSNIFDILIGLGLPFLLMILVKPVKAVNVSTNDLIVAFGFLFGSIIIMLAMLIFSRWETRKSTGITLIFLYLVYLSYEITLQF